MRLLLDTNILIARSLDCRALDTQIVGAIEAADNPSCASVVSLWKIAIKSRIGKLSTPLSAIQIADYFDAMGLPFLPITRDQVLAELEEKPNTRDPFDRLLLAICQVEGMRLVTLDRVLATHPLAWR
jgi:PIN domain nuclease of toxin-antitoxin system